MLARRIIPCLDVKDGRVVKGVNFVDLRDAGDPVEVAAAYNAAGADEVCFLDITASSDNRGTILDVVRRTAETVFIPLTVGGGVRTLDDIKNLLRAGADKVSINTRAVQDPDFVAAAARRFGNQCIVVAIDAKNIATLKPEHAAQPFPEWGWKSAHSTVDVWCAPADISPPNPSPTSGEGKPGSFPTSGEGRPAASQAYGEQGVRWGNVPLPRLPGKVGMGSWEVFTHGGRNRTGIDVVKWARWMEKLGAGEILLTSMDRDGTKDGYDLGVTRAVSDAVSIPVIASGGVGKLEDFKTGFVEGRADAALAASVFHFKTFTVGEVKEYLKQQGVPVRIAP